MATGHLSDPQLEIIKKLQAHDCSSGLTVISHDLPITAQLRS